MLACLAATDLMTGVLGQPVLIANQIYRLTGAGSFASDFCGLRNITCGTSAVASFQHLILISIERYIAIKYSYRYHAIITKRPLVGAVLTASLLVIFPSLFSIFVNSSSVIFPIFRVFTIALSICVLVYCRIAVYHEARKQMLEIKTPRVGCVLALKGKLFQRTEPRYWKLRFPASVLGLGTKRLYFEFRRLCE